MRRVSKIFCRANFRSLVASVLLGAFLWSPVVAAETLTNNDIVKLVKAGLGNDTINLSIRSAANTQFDTSANGLAALAKAGVPDTVVQSMIKRGSGSAPAAAAPATVIRPIKTVRRKVQPAAITPQAGASYFTRYNLWYERKKHSTTNYSRGTLLPVNSAVTLVDITDKKMLLELDSGETLTVALVAKTSLRPLSDIAAELLSPKQIPLARLGKDLAKHISSGTMRLGMTKEQVLMTRGYPPRHKTPALDGDQWVYWSSRFVHRTLVFQDGLLARGRSIN